MRVVVEGDLEEVVDGKRFPGLGNWLDKESKGVDLKEKRKTLPSNISAWLLVVWWLHKKNK